MSISQDGNSDYGSDFTPDQEEILNRLLQDTPPNSVIEDNENLTTSRSSFESGQNPRRRGAHSIQRWKKAKSRVSIEIEGHDGSFTIGKSRIDWRGETD